MSKILDIPIKCVAKRAGTICNIVSPSMFPKKSKSATSWLSTKGFHKCGHLKYCACNFPMVSSTFSSMSMPDQPSFDIDSYINCNSRNVIYMITCQECLIQYVGCTSNALKIHIMHHLSDVANDKALRLSSASKHYVDTHNRDIAYFSILGIEKVCKDPRGMRHAQTSREGEILDVPPGHQIPDGT